MIERVLFCGSKRLGLATLATIHALRSDALVGCLTIDDSDDTRSCLDEIVRFCSQNDVHCEIAKNKRASESYLNTVDFDLAILCGWYWIIPKRALNQAKNGFLVLHNSLLPRYRGAAPLVWAIMNNETRVGVSLFEIGEGVDDGPVFAQCSTHVSSVDTIGDILARLEEEAPTMLNSVYPRILAGDIDPRPQDHRSATHGCRRTPADGLIDWDQPALNLHNFIRAQSAPYPGAFTHYDGEKLTIWRSRIAEEEVYGSPGQVACIANDEVMICAGGNEAVWIKSVRYGDSKNALASSVIKTTARRLG